MNEPTVPTVDRRRGRGNHAIRRTLAGVLLAALALLAIPLDAAAQASSYG